MIRLLSDVDRKPEAIYKNGVVKVLFKKAKKKIKGRKIEIE